ncbi:MAG: HIT family protein [bacterium]|nr:HIT family protein [bacterium]
MDCLFCKIACHEIPALVIREDANTLAFLDIDPRAAGHTVVIPKRHAGTLLDIPREELCPLWQAVQAATAQLHTTLRPDGFTVGVNHGKHAGQAIDHLHIHIVPRWEGDGGGSIHTVVDNPPTEPLAEIHQRIVQSQHS